MDTAGNRTDFTVTVDWIIPTASAGTSSPKSGDDEDEDNDNPDDLDDGGVTSINKDSPKPGTPSGGSSDASGGVTIKRASTQSHPGIVLGSTALGLMGLLLLWFFVLTNFTVKIVMLMDGKIVKRSKRRWILISPKGNKVLHVDFSVKTPHQMKIVSTMVKEGLAKKMREGQVVVKINGKVLEQFSIPKDIDKKYEKIVRI